MIFLIKYHRTTQELELKTYNASDRHKAEDTRLQYELDLLNKFASDYEIVILEAESEAALRQTHRRYFERADQIAST